MKDFIIYINKQIGETGQLREEATLEHIVAHSDNIARDIATQHPFVDGNKRTAFVVLFSEVQLYNPLIETKEFSYREYLTKQVKICICKHKKWLDILKNC